MKKQQFIKLELTLLDDNFSNISRSKRLIVDVDSLKEVSMRKAVIREFIDTLKNFVGINK